MAKNRPDKQWISWALIGIGKALTSKVSIRNGKAQIRSYRGGIVKRDIDSAEGEEN